MIDIGACRGSKMTPYPPHTLQQDVYVGKKLVIQVLTPEAHGNIFCNAKAQQKTPEAFKDYRGVV